MFTNHYKEQTMSKNHSNTKRVEQQIVPVEPIVESTSTSIPTSTPIVQEPQMPEAIVPTTSQIDPRYDETYLQSLTTTSARIRYLHSRGLKNGEIAKKLGKLYQHVRNVLIVPVKIPRDSTPINELKAVEPVSQD
jgi:hypothetical protein